MHHVNGTKDTCQNEDNTVDWDLDYDECATKLAAKPKKAATNTKAKVSVKKTTDLA